MSIGIVSALEEEVRFLLDNLELEEAQARLGKAFHRGILAGQQVVIVSLGVGKVRAAARTQFLLDHFPVEKVILVGVAGALNPELQPGDVVVCRQVLEHDFDLSGAFTPDKMGGHWYQADPELVGLALEAGQRSGIPARAGLVLSGDQVIALASKREWLRQTFGGDCVEMEGVAVAMVCWLNRVPFVIIRGISDRADENILSEASLWLSEASVRSARVVLEMLRAWHPASAPAQREGYGTLSNLDI